MPEVSKNSSSKYKVNIEEYDRNYERIFGKNYDEIIIDEESDEIEGLIK